MRATTDPAAVTTPQPRRPAPRVLYVAGDGRSGSTLLGRLLHRVDGAVHVGEIVHLWQRGVVDDERCGCGERFSVCSFWCEVGAQAFGGWSGAAERMRALQRQVDRQRYLPYLASPAAPARFRHALDAYAQGLTALYRAIRDVSGCETIVDTSKHASQAFVIARAAAVDLRVIHLVRDSRGVVNSWTRTVRRPEVDDPEAVMPRYRPLHAAGRWLSVNVEVEVLRSLGVTATALRYEDLVAAPVDALRTVLADLRIDVPRTLGFLADETIDLVREHSVAGNPLRFRREPIALRLDEGWRRELGQRSACAVTAATWPLLRRYGYVGGASLTPGTPEVPAALAMVLQRMSDGHSTQTTDHQVLGLLPSAERPRLVLPLTPLTVAAAAVRHSSVGSGWGGRVARSALAAGMRLGVAQPLVRARTRVAFDGSPLVELLRDAVGDDVAAVSVRMGPARPNSKPVLQVMAADGTVLAYAKAGWNELTRQLVADEARALAAIDGGRGVVRAPRLLGIDTIDGLRIGVFSKVMQATTVTGDAADRLLMTALRTITTLGGGRSSAPLHASPFVAALRTRVDGLAVPTERTSATAVLERLAQRPVTIDVGFSHGDFTPWNTAVHRDAVHVWDWERARDGVPVGFDALHWHLQVALHRERRSVADAVQAAITRGSRWLAPLEVDPSVVPLLTHLHLLDLVVRYLQTPVPDRPDAVDLWCRDALGHLGQEQASP